jgi:hypothetical protein
MSKFAVLGALLLTVLVIPARAQEVAGDWIGQLNGGFKVRVHLEKNASGYSGHLTSPSGNETDFDQVTFDGTHLHFEISKIDLSYDAIWSDQEKAWNGSLTFQQVYPLFVIPFPAPMLVKHCSQLHKVCSAVRLLAIQCSDWNALDEQ